MKAVLGLPYMGIAPRSVILNSKCQGCFHYSSAEGISGLCRVGLSPQTCGEDGADPLVSYAPLTRGGGPNGRQAAVDRHPSHALLVEHISDKQAGLVKSIVGQLEERIRYGCSLHNPATYAASERRCSCAPIDPAFVAKAVRARLSNAVREGTTDDEVLEFVKAKMEELGIEVVPSEMQKAEYLLPHRVHAAAAAHVAKHGSSMNRDFNRTVLTAASNELASRGGVTANSERHHATESEGHYKHASAAQERGDAVHHVGHIAMGMAHSHATIQARLMKKR